jgi:hypothetical protein
MPQTMVSGKPDLTVSSQRFVSRLQGGLIPIRNDSSPNEHWISRKKQWILARMSIDISGS